MTSADVRRSIGCESFGDSSTKVRAGSQVYVLMDKGDGTFQTAVSYPTATWAAGVWDFNGDGKLSLAAASNSGDHAKSRYLFRKTPNDRFSLKPVFKVMPIPAPTLLVKLER